MIYGVNGEKISTPQIRIAPEHKDISHKLPKRPEEKLPSFMQMSEAELLAHMISALRLKYNPLDYRSDPKYKAKVDSVLLGGMVSMMVDYLRKNGTDLEAVFKMGRIEVK